MGYIIPCFKVLKEEGDMAIHTFDLSIQEAETGKSL